MILFLFQHGFLLVFIVLLLECTSAARLAQAAFKGDLIIQDLFVSNPIEADVSSSYNGTLHVIVFDQDDSSERPIPCQIEWKAGVSPPAASKYQCENSTLRAWFPESTFKGVKDFQLQFAHTIIDTDVGSCPEYCYVTKYAMINMTYPGTPFYGCDLKNAVCEQYVNTSIKAPVYLVVS